MFTISGAKQIFPTAPAGRVEIFYKPLVAAMDEWEIESVPQQAHFLAQIAHESGSLRWLEEIWGPTSQQLTYEGRRDLGNTQPGDGKKYKGHGLFA